MNDKAEEFLKKSHELFVSNLKGLIDWHVLNLMNSGVPPVDALNMTFKWLGECADYWKKKSDEGGAFVIKTCDPQVVIFTTEISPEVTKKAVDQLLNG